MLANMKPTINLFLLLISALPAALYLTGCAVQQPMAAQRNWTGGEMVQEPPARPVSMFTRPAAKPKMMVAAPAEPAPEPAPAPVAQTAVEPAPKRPGPLTLSEENEIDNQVMP